MRTDMEEEMLQLMIKEEAEKQQLVMEIIGNCRSNKVFEAAIQLLVILEVKAQGIAVCDEAQVKQWHKWVSAVRFRIEQGNDFVQNWWSELLKEATSTGDVAGAAEDDHELKFPWLLLLEI
ncbi:hypothetical protein C5167_043720 [Papaver somniferum]|uniref:Uncharacterized protein n=1 Tax=Papaver somniferum TaxID=3469 RepID=A0A4Y7LAD0_PAPSO|nr:hypothetical protein C5167_043720 [Papaver somniferum]